MHDAPVAALAAAIALAAAAPMPSPHVPADPRLGARAGPPPLALRGLAEQAEEALGALGCPSPPGPGMGGGLADLAFEPRRRDDHEARASVRCSPAAARRAGLGPVAAAAVVLGRQGEASDRGEFASLSLSWEETGDAGRDAEASADALLSGRIVLAIYGAADPVGPLRWFAPPPSPAAAERPWAAMFWPLPGGATVSVQVDPFGPGGTVRRTLRVVAPAAAPQTEPGAGDPAEVDAPADG